MLSCRPFYLPKDFTTVIRAVWKQPQANTKPALEQLQSAIINSMLAPPDRIVMAAGDFNHGNF